MLTSKGQSMPLGFGNNAESLQSPDRMLPLFNIRGKVHSRRLSQEEIAQNMSNAAILKKNAITMHIESEKMHQKRFESPKTIKEKVIKMYSNRSPQKNAKITNKIDLLVAERSKPKLKTIKQKYKQMVDDGTIFNEIKVSNRLRPNLDVERFFEMRNKENSDSEKEQVVEEQEEKNTQDVFGIETLSNGVKHFK